MATVKAKPKKQQGRTAGIEPLTVKPTVAARRASVSYGEIIRAASRDVFTIIAPHGRGVGKPYWLFLDEVDAWAVGRDAAVRELRYKKGRLKRGQ